MMEELGSGFYLAMHDLEIRGAGEVLGESQSGEMQEVGFNLYNDMLAHAVRSLQAGPRARSDPAARRHHRDQPARARPAAGRLLLRRARAARALQAPGELRLAGGAHRHARGARSTASARCPETAQALVESHRLRILGHPLGVVRSTRPRRPRADPVRRRTPRSTPGTVIELVQKSRGWKLAGPTKLRAAVAVATLKERAAAVRHVLGMLGSRPA